MSQLTDYAENKLVDLWRGQAWSLPDSLYIALASAASDGAITELSGTGYARVEVARALASWAGTQGSGTTLPSSGTSHATSNNAELDWGTAGSAWGTASHIGICDADSGGHVLAWIALQDPLVIGSGDPVSIAAGAVQMTLGLTGGCSDYLANKLLDFVFRGQSFSFPAQAYFGYTTSAPTNSSDGAEVAGGGYARKGVDCSLLAWSGTQGAGTTVASTGTGGRTSNNAAIEFPAPTGDQGTVTHAIVKDAPTAGNLLFWRALSSPKTVNAGGAAPKFNADSFGITFA